MLFNHQSQGLQEVINNEQIIQSREQEINKLHKGVEEISELFQDMSILVSQQGETIDNIQLNIESANKNTDLANIQLIKANKYQKSYNSRYCCCFFGLIIIILIILIIKLI